MENGISLPADVQVLSHQIAGHKFQKDDNGDIKSGNYQFCKFFYYFLKVKCLSFFKRSFTKRKFRS